MLKTRGALRIPCCILLALFCTHGKGADNRPASPGKSTCGKPATPVSSIQGSGSTSPFIGKLVDVEAVVVGQFQGKDALGGLFVQEEEQDQDGNKQSSEGLFVHTRLPASVGDLVHVRGTVAEFKELTELHPVQALAVCGTGVVVPTATDLHLPLTSAKMLEALESMRIALPQTVTIIDTRNFRQFGELVVASERQIQPTQFAPPGEKALHMYRAQALDRLIVDDGRAGRNLPSNIPALDPSGHDRPVPLSAHDSVRTGQELTGLEGVLHFAFGNYRLQPVAPFALLAEANPRTSQPPSAGGTLRVASFNVLNYFSTLKDSGNGCGPGLNRGCRGADTKQEQQRQLQKLVAAISAIDAGIVGLLELENNTSQSLQDLVGALNKAVGAGQYAFIATGTIGRDVIKAGLLYQPALVTPQGRFALLDSRVDRRFDDSLNRPALAQSFRIAEGDRKLTVVVTHLKSKHCPDADAGPGANAGGPNQDMKDGEGCFNHTRSEAAAALAAWSLSNPTGTDPTGTGATQVLIVGDFNSHRMEDPVRALEKSGFINLLARSGGAEAYTYVYDGRAGTLDYAFASPQLLPFVSGAAAWHINADEPEVLDYNIEAGKPASYFARNPFRSSDHDPVIIGLDLGK
jgi:hypothetical protein